MQTMTIRAPAKINLYLAVTGKEENGYHTVETVMQAISLFDVVTVTKRKASLTAECITISCNHPDIPCDKTNLAWRAAIRFFEEYRTPFPIHIQIEKHIPIAGGLAGGSTNAAAVLVLLNRLTGSPFSRERLLSMGAALGMDVPFCILSCMGISTALGLHYGEKMLPCTPIPPCTVLAASSGEQVSTPWAYQMIDNNPLASVNYLPLLHALDASDLSSVFSHMYNAFEGVILPQRDKARQCHTLLSESGTDKVLMSGSGPTVIALYTSKETAQRALKTVNASGMHAVLCTTLS